MMTNKEFVAKLKDIVTNYKTLYVMGGIGDYLTSSIKKYYITDPEAHDYNKTAKRIKMINSASTDTVAFDCVGLIKAVLWGWNGSKTKSHGGAVYKSNGVPELWADALITKCTDLSTNFSKIEIGEIVWKKGHVGVYIGDGLAIECTPSWANKVQTTSCNCSKAGYNRRNWTKHGKLSYIDYSTPIEAPAVTGTPSTGTSADEKKIWDYLMSKIGNAYGVAGLMGNLYAESALKSNNLQQTYEKKLGYTDITYTAAVDIGTYTNFVKDSAGYGLAQWTYWSRKENLLKYAKGQHKSVGDLSVQLEFLYKELSESYKGVFTTLKNATSVLSASNVVLLNFERPADQGTQVQKKRAEYGQKYYDKYAIKNSNSTTTNQSSTETPVAKPWTPTVGDVVSYKGNVHYTSANATTGKSCVGGKAVITNIYQLGKSKHPYHLKRVSGGGATVYGWVDAGTFTKV